jgi:hypothetical protein
MLPTPKPKEPAKATTSMVLPEDVLRRIGEIAKTEKVSSRNGVIVSFLCFATELFPLLKPLRGQISALEKAEGITYAEAVARLVTRGLKASRK